MLQEDGLDTYEANHALGFEADSRNYFDSAAIMTYLFPNMSGIKLLSNNPEKAKRLSQYGININSYESVIAGHSHHNRRYIDAKSKNNHMLNYEGDFQ